MGQTHILKKELALRNLNRSYKNVLNLFTSLQTCMSRPLLDSDSGAVLLWSVDNHCARAHCPRGFHWPEHYWLYIYCYRPIKTSEAIVATQ